MLRSLFSRRNRDWEREHDISDILDNVQPHSFLELIILKPYIQDVGNGYFVSWSRFNPKTEQHEISKQLLSDLQRLDCSVAEKAIKLSFRESDMVKAYLKSRRGAVLLSAFSTLVDLEQDGLKMCGIPEPRFIFRVPEKTQLALSLDKHPETLHDSRLVHARALERPTYVSVSLQYMDPRTLNAFGLPWEFDPVKKSNPSNTVAPAS